MGAFGSCLRLIVGRERIMALVRKRGIKSLVLKRRIGQCERSEGEGLQLCVYFMKILGNDKLEIVRRSSTLVIYTRHTGSFSHQDILQRNYGFTVDIELDRE